MINIYFLLKDVHLIGFEKALNPKTTHTKDYELFGKFHIASNLVLS